MIDLEASAAPFQFSHSAEAVLAVKMEVAVAVAPALPLLASPSLAAVEPALPLLALPLLVAVAEVLEAEDKFHFMMIKMDGHIHGELHRTLMVVKVVTD